MYNAPLMKVVALVPVFTDESQVYFVLHGGWQKSISEKGKKGKCFGQHGFLFFQALTKVVMRISVHMAL